MHRHVNRISRAAAATMIALGVLWACGAALSQQGGAAPNPQAGQPRPPAVQPPPAGQRPAPAGGQQAGTPGAGGITVQGTVIEKDAKNNAVHLKTPQGQGWVQFPQATPIFKFVPAKPDEIKEKDVITVYGIATAIDARSVEVVPPDAPAAPAADGKAPAPPAGEQFVPRSTAMASVTGVVVSLKPLTLAVGRNLKITVATSERTRVLRRTQADLNAIAVGDSVTALGDMQRPDVMQARAGWIRPQEGGQEGRGRRPQDGGRRPGGEQPAAKPPAEQPAAKPAAEQPGGNPPAEQPGAQAPEAK